MRAVAACAALLLIVGCGQSAALQTMPPSPYGSRTQIIVQWQLPAGKANALSEIAALQRYFDAEELITKSEGDLFEEDGNDVGGGLFNVYLYSDKVDETVAAIIKLDAGGKLPTGTRIGVAQYKDAARTDWTYRPVYPAGLSTFDVFPVAPIVDSPDKD